MRLRRGTKRVDRTDKRSPMLRLLQDGQIEERNGEQMIAHGYDQQFKTLMKAQALGYIDARQMLTDKGREFLARHA